MKKRIKILYIIPTLDQGGAERFTVDLLINLNQEEFSPYLLLFKRGGVWISEIEKKNIPVKILIKKWRFDLMNFYNIYKFICDLKPDIIHTQLGGDVYGRLAARLAGVKKIISTEQNVNPDESWLINFLKRFTAQYSRLTIAITEAVRKDAIKRYDLDVAKTVVIPNGINIKKFTLIQQRPPRSGKDLVFGTIGRLSKQKGHSYLIEAMALAKTSAKCLIAGMGDLKQELEQQITTLTLNDKIKLVGPISDVPSFLNDLDVFVFPSLWEGQGIALMEAGLARRPIIASAVDGIKEVLDDETAWLVPAQDSQALAQMIIWLSNNINSPIVKQKTDKLFLRISERYSIQKIVDQYQIVYKDLFTNKL